MGFAVGGFHRFGGDVGVFLSCRKGTVAENFFDKHQIGAILEHMSGKRMPESVRSKRHPLAFCKRFDQTIDRSDSEWRAALI